LIAGFLSTLAMLLSAAAFPVPSHCPAGHPACRETVGITLPGLTAIDDLVA
jgi:hypothetical protein